MDGVFPCFGNEIIWERRVVRRGGSESLTGAVGEAVVRRKRREPPSETEDTFAREREEETSERERVMKGGYERVKRGANER